MFAPSSAPVLLPQMEEMVVPLHTPFTLTCRGEAKLGWATPLPVDEQTQEDNSGLFVTSITVDSAAAMHTGYYTCTYVSNITEEMEDSSIYIYVPGMCCTAAFVLVYGHNFTLLSWQSFFLTPAQTQMFHLCLHWCRLVTTSCLTTRRWRSSAECLIPALTWL